MNQANVIQFPYAMLAVFVVAVGCGGDRAEVTGHVLRSDGQPVARARVIARSESGASAYGITSEKGQFNLNAGDAGEGLDPGQYAVIIVEDRGRTDNMRPASISTKYADPAQSGLAFTVEPGEHKIFEVTVDAQ
jgi:hypothetical protein